jgi:hypothetical protein
MCRSEPQIAGGSDPEDDVGWLFDFWVFDIFDHHPFGHGKYDSFHGNLLVLLVFQSVAAVFIHGGPAELHPFHASAGAGELRPAASLHPAFMLKADAVVVGLKTSGQSRAMRNRRMGN